MLKLLKIFLISAILVTFTSALLFYYESRASSSAGITATVAVGVCGNNIVEYGEDCDGSALDGQTCESRGYDGGTLICGVGCDFNVFECVNLKPEDTTGSAVFSGRAYPDSAVKVLKDGQIAATTASGSDGSFETTLSNLAAGAYSFAVYAYDNNGEKSNTLTYRKDIAEREIIEISPIIIAPTVNSEKVEVKKNESVSIYGQSIPSEEITMEVISSGKDFSRTETAGSDGIYSFKIKTDDLDYGKYKARTKAILANSQSSDWSDPVYFTVSTRTLLADAKSGDFKSGDYNGDYKINLIDFSILLYWYERSSFPANVDLNGDKKVDIVDFSILAYYWTG